MFVINKYTVFYNWLLRVYIGNLSLLYSVLLETNLAPLHENLAPFRAKYNSDLFLWRYRW